MVSSIMASNESEYTAEKTLLVKVIHIEVADKPMANMSAINKIVAYRNVHTLNLCGTDVTDVSALSDVHTLNLCLTNVSPMCRH